MTLVRSAAMIGFFTMISRVFGFIRDMAIASFIGANATTDAFFVAFKLPNFMRRLFAEGAFNSAFVPVYASTLAGEGKEAAQKFAAEAQALLLLALLGVTILAELFMPACVNILAPGFSAFPEKYELTVELTRITFPYIIFISLVSLLGGVLNSNSRFSAVAATPILMNITMIVMLVIFRDVLKTPAHALAWGVAAAGVTQYIWLVWSCNRAGILPKFQKPAITQPIRKLLRLIAPAALGAGVVQINLMVDMIIGSHVPDGVSYLYYADRINELPLAVIGIAIGTVLLPVLSKQMREENIAQAMHTQNRAIELVLLLSLPSAAGIIMIAQPIITTLFQYGEFTLKATEATYPALIAFGAGLPAFVLVKVLAPGFYANHDTKTPFYIAVICVLLNFLLNITLIGPMQHVGLALATTISGWVNAASMAFILHKRKLLMIDSLMRHRIPRMLCATIVMAAGLAVSYGFVSTGFLGTVTERAISLSLLIGFGVSLYALMAFQLRILTWQQFAASFSRTQK